MARLGQDDTATMAALAALLVDQLPAAIAATRATTGQDNGPLSPPRFLKAWRDELARKNEAAVSPARLAAAIPTLFSVCDVGIEMQGSSPGIHLRGAASSALDTALRVMHVQDRARGTAVGEALMAMLLADVADVGFAMQERGAGVVH